MGTKVRGIAFKHRFWLAHPRFWGRRRVRCHLPHSSSLGPRLPSDMAQRLLWAAGAQMFSFKSGIGVSRAVSPAPGFAIAVCVGRSRELAQS